MSNLEQAVPESSGLEMRAVGAVLARRWMVLAVAASIGVLAAVLVAATSTSEYTSTSTIVVNPVVVEPLSVRPRVNDNVSIATEIERLRSDAMIGTLKSQLGGDESEEDLRERLSVRGTGGGFSINEALTIDVSFTASSADEAKAGVEAVTDSYLQERTNRSEAAIRDAKNQIDSEIALLENRRQAEIDRLNTLDRASGAANVASLNVSALDGRLADLRQQQRQLSGIATAGGAVIRAATVPSSPDGIPAWLVAIGMFLAVMAVGVVVAIVWDRADGGVRSSRDVADAVGAPPLAELPRGFSGSPIPEGERALALRRLVVRLLRHPEPERTSLQLVGLDASTGEMAVELGAVAAAGGRRVIVVLPDPPQQHSDFLGPYLKGPGVRELIAGVNRYMDASVPVTGVPGVEVVGPGDENIPIDPATSEHVRLLGRILAREEPDLVIVATDSPLDDLTPLYFSAMTDESIVVVDRRQARRVELVEAMEELRSAGADVSGVVLR